MAQVPRPSWISSNEGRTPLRSDKDLTFWIQLPELFLHQASSSSGDIVIVLQLSRWFFWLQFTWDPIVWQLILFLAYQVTFWIRSQKGILFTKLERDSKQSSGKNADRLEKIRELWYGRVTPPVGRVLLYFIQLLIGYCCTFSNYRQGTAVLFPTIDRVLLYCW